MIIQINDRYRIISDTHQFILQRLRTVGKDNRERWDGFSYHRTLAGLIDDLVWRDFRAGGESTEETLTEALARVEVLAGQLKTALAPLLTIEIAPKFIRIGRAIRYLREDLDAFLDEMRERSNGSQGRG